MISLENERHLFKIAKNMVDLGKMMGKCRFCSYSGETVGGGKWRSTGKIIVAIGLEKLPKVQ